MGSFFTKAIDYLMQNARILWDAPLVFVATTLLACGVAYFLVALRFQGVVDQRTAALEQKTATIESLKAQIDGLQDRLKDIQQQLALRPTPPAPSIPPSMARDPDGIYQFGIQVGTGQMAQADESRGLVRFATISGAVKFNEKKEFEYRNFVLRVKEVMATNDAHVAGQVYRRFIQVTCEIIGRVP